MIKEKLKYYIIKDLDTGLYYRGKGQNRWGKYYNQASIFRNLAQANNSVEQLKIYDKSNAVAIEIEINEITQNHILSECIKEWEDRGWKTSYICDGINLSKLIDGIVEYFYFDKDLKRIDCNCFISFDLIPLIHKTLKALEEMKDD